MVKLIEAIDIAIEQARKSNGPFKHGCRDVWQKCDSQGE